MSVRYRSTAIAFVASVGLLISALITFQETDSFLAMALLMMVSFASFILSSGGTK